jgi:hypothetical protein
MLQNNVAVGTAVWKSVGAGAMFARIVVGDVTGITVALGSEIDVGIEMTAGSEGVGGSALDPPTEPSSVTPTMAAAIHTETIANLRPYAGGNNPLSNFIGARVYHRGVDSPHASCNIM